MPIDVPPRLDHRSGLPLDRPFDRAEALATVSRRRLVKLVAEGALRRPIAGVYVAAQVPDSLSVRCRALRLVVPAGCFVADDTAAWLHGAPMALAPNDHLSVPPVRCFRPAREGRLRNDLTDSGERTVQPRDLTEVDGVLVTTPLRTALDLGRLRRRDHALSGMDALLRLGTFTHAELLGSVERFARRRGVVQLRALAAIADGRAESPGESALRLRWYDAGLPRPELQIPVVMDNGACFRLDLGLEELLFAAEYDGAEWHSSDSQRVRDAARRESLRRHRSWVVEVFRADSVYGARQDADVRLRRAARAARASLASRRFLL